jgi:septal ring factor EnvC (AmiA/AmiB activator)
MRFWLFILGILATTAVFGQKSAKVMELENQRKAALQEIEVSSKLLAQTRESAQASLNSLNLLAAQIRQRRQVISIMNQEMAELDKEIASRRRQIAVLEAELKQKRDKYAESLRRLQSRHNSQDKLLFIFSADNFGQSVRRMRYLREYAAWQRRQAVEIIEKQKSLRDQWDALEKSRKDKQALLATREQEQQKLETEEAVLRTEVQALNRKQKQLQEELRRKRRQADALNRQIERQIAEEVARAAREAKEAAARKESNKANARVAESAGGYAMTREEKALSDNFASNRGRLPVPVTKAYTVSGYFGEQQHPELKYVRVVNNGVDLQTSEGADARAVFNGTVSAVFVEPSYSVIIRHGNYLTVYSNLSEIYVKKGDKVRTRQAIGKIYTDDDNGNATILHFELWKETKKQNPLPWLSR